MLLISSPSKSSQILDYETEEFIKKIIYKVKLVNNINRDIDFEILKDKNINAFVNEENKIFLTSSLIENSPDYVALLSVIAHEIGHIDNNHIGTRKNSIYKIKEINNISNISFLAGSLISGNPELLKGMILSNAASSNYYLGFSKEQEIEADYYAINTLKKLKVDSSSVIELLTIIEDKSFQKGFDEDSQRLSTHPYFKDRIDMLEFSDNNKKYDIDKNLNNDFYYIKAKFAGHNTNYEIIQKLENNYKLYADSILETKKGDLINALKKINKVISMDKDNVFLLETKADILHSFGYTDEAIKFYKIVLNKYPENYYAKIRIFNSTKIENYSKEMLSEFFDDNLNILYRYYFNKKILTKYLSITKRNQMLEWENFLNFWILADKNDNNNIKSELEFYQKTTDLKLKKLVDIIYKIYI